MVESVRRQMNGLEYQFVIIDAASKDGTADWLAEQPDVVWGQQGGQYGAIPAFQIGFKQTRGDFVVNLNDDLLIHGDVITHGYQPVENQPEDRANSNSLHYAYPSALTCKRFAWAKRPSWCTRISVSSQGSSVIDLAGGPTCIATTLVIHTSVFPCGTWACKLYASRAAGTSSTWRCGTTPDARGRTRTNSFSIGRDGIDRLACRAARCSVGPAGWAIWCNSRVSTGL